MAVTLLNLLEVFFVALICCPVSIKCSKVLPCFSDEMRIVKNLATKTPYRFLIDEAANKVLSPDIYDVKKIWMIARHGTRYPSDSGLDAFLNRLPKLVDRIQENVSQGRGTLCNKDVKTLRHWVNQTRESILDHPNLEEKILHAEGELEHIFLAERLRNRFPGLLPSTYSRENFRFRATNTQRSIQSQLFFATGLFDRRVAQKEVVYDEPIRPHDPLIRFYKACPKWIMDVKKSADSLSEMKKFENSETFRTRLIEPLSSRLGFGDVQLTLDEIETLYVTCTFGQAFHPLQPNPICQLFTDSEMFIMEYREDLEYYWQDGYGYKINSAPACILLKNVLETLEDPSSPTGTFYFTHSGTILKFLAFLGLHRDDEPLRSDNFDKVAESRHWRTSLIDGFASNLAFVLRSSNKGLTIGLFHNERLIEIPGCDGLWCSPDVLKKVFSKQLENSDLASICATDKLVSEGATADDRF